MTSELEGEMGDFRKGDKVAVKKAYLDASPDDISCLRIVRHGLPNEFLVSDTDMSLDGVPAVVLSPCCNRLADPDTGEISCVGHPAELFELLSRADAASSSLDKIMEALSKTEPKNFASVDTPFGRFLQAGHYEDEQHVGFSFSVFGLKPLVFAGKKSKALSDVVDFIKRMEIL
jgi:hypothetical protein